MSWGGRGCESDLKEYIVSRSIEIELILPFTSGRTILDKYFSKGIMVDARDESEIPDD